MDEASHRSQNGLQSFMLNPRIEVPPSVEQSQFDLYPLTSLARAVVQRYEFRSLVKGGASHMFGLLDSSGNQVDLSSPLLQVLAKNDNCLRLVEDASAMRNMNETQESIPELFGYLPFSVLYEDLADMHHDIAVKIHNVLPTAQFRIVDQDGHESPPGTLNAASWLANTGRRHLVIQPYMAEVAAAQQDHSMLHVEIAHGLSISMDSNYYTIDSSPSNRLQFSNRVLDALVNFVRDASPSLPLSGNIHQNDIKPILDSLPPRFTSGLDTLSGHELVEEVASRISRLDRERKAKMRALQIRRDSAESQLELAQQSMANRIQAAAPNGWFVTALRQIAGFGLLVLSAIGYYGMSLFDTAFFLPVCYAIGMTAFMWYTDRWNTPLYIAVAFYAYLFVAAAVLRRWWGFSIQDYVVTHAFPTIYPQDVASIPQDTVDTAAKNLAEEQAVDYDSIVQLLVVKPSWFQVLAISVCSLDAGLFRAWKRKIGQRRDSAFQKVVALVSARHETLKAAQLAESAHQQVELAGLNHEDQDQPDQENRVVAGARD